MPLSATREAGVWEARTDNVYFVMMYSGHRIRCGVTGQTLEAIDPKVERTGRGRLDALDTHRSIIERLASARFDNKKWEVDGITILVTTADLQNN
jgi:hypothetical protein